MTTTYNLDTHFNLGHQFPAAAPQHEQMELPMDTTDRRPAYDMSRVRDNLLARADVQGPQRHEAWINSPNAGSPDRNFYNHIPGQRVMDVPGTEHNPRPLELNAHGNVYDPNVNDKLYSRYAPQMGPHAAETFNRHSVPMRLSTSTVLHTLQRDTATFEEQPDGTKRLSSHRNIQGPIRQDGEWSSMRPDGEYDHEYSEGPIPIIIHQGRPVLVDGHHRLAEMRGRGMTHFNARVFNADQFEDHLDRMKEPRVQDMMDHLIDNHHVTPSVFNRLDAGTDSPWQRLHQAHHDMMPISHEHQPRTYNLDADE